MGWVSLAPDKNTWKAPLNELVYKCLASGVSYQYILLDGGGGAK
jgi:hypothetical protein